MNKKLLAPISVCIIHTLYSKQLMKLLKADGWYQVAVKGSHFQFKHPHKKGRVTVPHPKRDLPIGTLKSIMKQAQVKL